MRQIKQIAGIPHGFSLNLATKLKKPVASRLELSTAERLCMLLNCTPNDILELIPDKENQLKPEHPLHKIIRPEKIVDITRTLSNVTVEKLEKIEKMIQDEIDGKE